MSLDVYIYTPVHDAFSSSTPGGTSKKDIYIYDIYIYVEYIYIYI